VKLAITGATGFPVALLIFQMKRDPPAGNAFVDVQQDLAPQGGSERTALFGRDTLGQPFQFTLSPAPMDAPRSSDDGGVTVV
jgi:hypothetical protein